MNTAALRNQGRFFAASGGRHEQISLLTRPRIGGLDRGDGIENEALKQPPTPEEIVFDKWDKAQLYAAFAQLPDKQAKRLYAFFFLGMSKTEIARAEKISVKAVCNAIVRGLETLQKNLEKV